MVSVGRDEPRRPRRAARRGSGRIIDAARRGPRGGCVAEGRDITTVVAPDADVRLLLTATEEARLARRALRRPRHRRRRRDRGDPRPGAPPRRRRLDGVAASTSPRTASSAARLLGPGLRADRRGRAGGGARAAARPSGHDRARRSRGRPRRTRASTARCAPGSTTTTSATRTARSSRREGRGRRRGPDAGPLPVLADRRPAERRQVDAGQPRARPPRGGRAGRPGRHPRPRDLRGRVGRPPVHRWSTPAAGSATSAGCRRAWPSRRRSRSSWRTRSLFVVDAKVGATDTDEAVVRLLRRSGKPVVLAANKVDDLRGEADAAALWSLGLGEPHPVSGAARPGERRPAGRRPRGAAAGVGGRRAAPRAGCAGWRWSAGRTSAKSACSTRVAGTERVVVDAVAGHHARPGGRDGRARRPAVAVRRHGGDPAPRAPGRRARTSTPRCAPRRRWRRPRSPSSCSTPASRWPSRTPA